MMDFIRKITWDFNEYSEKMSVNINFAWEIDKNNELTLNNLRAAREIINKTKTLVFIGYSFPTFNKKIDTSILGSIIRNNPKIYLLDPNATKETLIPILGTNVISSIVEITNLKNGFTLPS
jgi:hypothetical protein